MNALTIFIGSFISFALEPMIGRALLPVFGGSPTVWVTCLAAFQLLMVAGYWYAERGMKNQGSGMRMRMHLALLVLAAVWCAVVGFAKGPILTALGSLTGIPSLDVFICVLAIAAFAFVLLSANATIVQAASGGNYRLYAVSNIGSLLGLFCYPILVEPYLALTTQWYVLSAAIFGYAALLALVVRGMKSRGSSEISQAQSEMQSTKHSAILYFLIPAVSTALLNATTSHLTLDIAPIPLLWAILLGIFLLSYIIGFSGWSRPVYWVFPALVLTGISIPVYCIGHTNNLYDLILRYSLALFFVCTFLHSWLYSIRPQTSKLPHFYLLNVLGGAVGGLFTSLVAPVIFTSILEFPILLIVSAAAFAVWALMQTGWFVRTIVALGLLASLAFSYASEKSNVSPNEPKAIFRSRGFFGTMRVMEGFRPQPNGQVDTIHGAYHGNTLHGLQLRGTGLERMPTVYYTPFACGHAVLAHPSYVANPKPMRVCMVGMGTGVYFVYARTNDFYRAYEISSEVIDVARDKNLFSFIDTCSVAPDIKLMDARKGLEAEAKANEEKYDVILVDAFSGDSIPYHLSTKEAIELYLSRLKSDGILCVHFSNKHLNLLPYILAIREEFGLQSMIYQSRVDHERFGFPTEAAIYYRKGTRVGGLPIQSGWCGYIDATGIKPLSPFPTDEKGSFLPLLKFGE